MAKRGGSTGLEVLGAIAVVAVIYAYLKTGRGEQNSPLLPDAFEDPIDRAVAALNRQFGKHWVNFGLGALQAYIEHAVPVAAGLVDRLYRAELAYRQTPNSGYAKKLAATQYA